MFDSMHLPDSERQLKTLLEDPVFLKAIALVTREVTRKWNYSNTAARRSVLSAIGEPMALDCIYHAWTAWRARKPDEKLVHPIVIIRRRVLDLLGRDARRTGHSSLPTTADDIEETENSALFDKNSQRNPLVQLEHWQIIQMIQRAVACFAAQGVVQRRQAELLRRHAFDEISYSELSVELACAEVALRVRMHKARRALLKHILVCHPELLSVRSPSARAWNL
jgi:DNA-directed RNA polymerase specialized sigma24 family protein